MNQNLAYHGRKLMWGGLIHSCFRTRNGVVHIKMNKHGKRLKVHHLNFFYDKFSDYDFVEEEDLFLDSSQDANTSAHLSY